jgi:hypothetical protein
MDESLVMDLRRVAIMDQYYACLADVARYSRDERRSWYRREEDRLVETVVRYATADIREGVRRAVRQVIADGLRRARNPRW